MAITATTLAVTSVALALVSAGVGTYAAVEQGKAAESASKYNAAVYKNNALTAMREANYQANRIRKRNAIIAGKQRAAYLKSGVDLSGSAEDVILDSAIEGELDVQAALYAGKSASSSSMARSRLAAYEGSESAKAGYMSGAGTLLGGLGSAAGKAYNMRTPTTNSQGPEF